MGKTSIYPLINFNGNLYATSKDMKPQYGQLCYYPTIDGGSLELFDNDEIWDNELCHVVIATTDRAHFSLPLLPTPKQEPSFDERVVEVMKNTFVRGQQYELAAIMRDEIKRFESKRLKPTDVELEIHDDNLNCRVVRWLYEYDDSGHN